MKSLNKHIQSDYEYAMRTYAPKSLLENQILSECDVVKVHFTLADYFIEVGETVNYGILHFNLLSSAVSRQNTEFAMVTKWKDDFEKIATLLFGLDKNHAFHDGNKRTALMSMLLGIHKINRQMSCKKKEVETLVTRIAANRMNEYKDFKFFAKHGDDATIKYIASFLKKKSRKIDNAYRCLTYDDFNKKLNKYGVRLDNPNGGFINVYQIRKERKLFGLITRDKEYKILQIGFPGWKKQINIKALKKVLKEARLTSEYGIDAKSFFEGEDPEYQLMDEYFEVLKRLKDK